MTELVCAPEHREEIEVPSGDYPVSKRLGGTQRVHAFFLDRFVVTVGRFAEFVNADGYDERSFWCEDGWLWRRRAGADRPRFWDDPKWVRYIESDRPVVGVCFYEAMAYCRFLGRRLPTEREWEAAVRGPQGHVFPWGDDWEDGRLGTRGVGERVTWKVGSFDGARGPFGHEDLIGNVWQWTNTRSEDLGPADEPDSDPMVIVKGGSWASPPDLARADQFNSYHRSSRFSHLGFRTARL